MRTFTALLIVTLPSLCSAGISFRGFGDVVQRGGFDIYIVTAVSDVGDIYAFDFEGDPDIDDDLGVFGPLHNISPFGLPTVFSNNNLAIAGAGEDPMLDSQFLFNGLDSPSVTFPDGFVREQPGLLAATFASSQPLGSEVPFVRVVVPIGSGWSLSGIVVAGPDFEEFRISANPFPEPMAGAMVLVAAACFATQLRRPRTTL